MEDADARRELDKANAAFVDENFDMALVHFNRAVDADPENAEVLCARAQAHLKLKNYVEASDDASSAAELDPQMGKAFMRKGVACFKLEEYEAAQEAFEQCAELEPENKTVRVWLARCSDELEAEEVAARKPKKDADGSHLYGHGTKSATVVSASSGTSAATRAALAAAKAREAAEEALRKPLSPAAPEVFGAKYRHQHHQTPAKVEVAVLAKKLTKDQVSVEIGEQRLRVAILSGDKQEEYKLEVELWGKVDVAKSKWELLSTKVEVVLVKAEPGQQWPGLEAGSGEAVPTIGAVGTEGVPHRPVYPSSSKTPKNWDALYAEVKEEEKNEKPDGDAGLQKLFQGIYKDADEDTRRAMNKSFQESNGTVLSTNWKDIGAKKTDWKAPDGMVAKQYEQ